MFGVAVAALALLFAQQVDGHGFMYTPRSRNYIAFEDGVETSQTGLYKKEHCKDCLNTNVGDPLGYSGYSGNTQVDYTLLPVNSAGQPMAWNTEITYMEGEEIVIEHSYTGASLWTRRGFRLSFGFSLYLGLLRKSSLLARICER